MPSDPDSKSPEDQPPRDPAVPAPIEGETDVVAATVKPVTASAAIVSIPDDPGPDKPTPDKPGPDNPRPATPRPDDPAGSGSIDVALSSPGHRALIDGTPVAIGDVSDSAPISSGRVTAMNVATSGPTESKPSKRLTDHAKDTFDKSVSRLGTGLEHLGEGVSKLGEKSKKVPLVGSGVSKLGEGIVHVGESLTDLPRAARSRRGRLLVRSFAVSFVLVFAWIAVIVMLQVRGTDAPDFRPEAERILAALGKGSAAIDEVYEKGSPRFHEMVRKEYFHELMTDLHATLGPYKEITSVHESLVTQGPSGRIGRVSLGVAYEKGSTKASVSLHWDDGRWKLLGVGIEVPQELEITQAQREERVAACKEPMDAKRCDVHVAANQILSQLRDGQADAVWDAASQVFQKQESKSRFKQIVAEHQAVLGEYRRIIAVTEAKVIGGTLATYDVLVEYAKTNVRVIFGFLRGSKAERWTLRSLKVALPMPRADDLTRDPGSLPPATGSGSAVGSGSGTPAVPSSTTPNPTPVRRNGSGSARAR